MVLHYIVSHVNQNKVDLKYTFVGQVIKVTYEGHERTFTVADISANANSGSDDVISERLARLSTEDSEPVLWTANWDTQVSLQQAPEQKKPEEPANGALGMFPHSLMAISTRYSNDILGPTTLSGYSSVGGLDKQISLIRDLIDIPLTRPDLFRHFGTLVTHPLQGLLQG